MGTTRVPPLYRASSLDLGRYRGVLFLSVNHGPKVVCWHLRLNIHQGAWLDSPSPENRAEGVVECVRLYRGPQIKLWEGVILFPTVSRGADEVGNGKKKDSKRQPNLR